VGADGYFRMINRLFGEFFAVNPSEVVGRKVADLGEFLSRAIENLENFLTQVAGTASDAESVFTETIVQKWPVPRELELTSVPVRAEGEFLGRLYAFRDVTRERESDRVKTEFLSMASHELRTPLTSIRGYIDLVFDGEAGEVSEHQREFLGVAKRNVDRLVKLVNDILDLSKMGSGRLQLQCEPVDVAAVIEHVVASLRPMMREIGQTLRMNVPPELPPVRGDQERLHQILFNLVSNAHKYTPQGGEITVAAHGGRSFVRVDIQDTGIGMSPQDLAQLFTRFFRSSNPAAQRAGGAGLGLSITRQLVELHGGTIDVHSAPGAGSTFSFTLPVA
ncbi:MAG TPA: ATP-binding protein, partial [Chloroflexota bacterium]|nr:ATP-binding protein [Chloroflexota bacterium]